jgi:hypothetical protein
MRGTLPSIAGYTGTLRQASVAAKPNVEKVK